MKKRFLQLSAIVLLGTAGLSVKAQSSWFITGNSNIIGNGTNFLGTSNSQPLIFKTNNVERLRIRGTGQIGIGTDVATYCLQIQNPAFQRGISVTNNFSGSQDRIGVYTSSVNAPGYGYGLQAYGGYYGAYIVGQGGNTGDDATGVYGLATGSGPGNRFGVYGIASGGQFTAAGYFAGDVWAVSYNTLSDRKVKTNITPLPNPLEQLMKLKPSAYEFKAAAYPTMGLPAGKQIGLIADEVKQVFPELVREAVHPAQYDKDTRVMLHAEEKYEGINYIGLIPILIASIQEQQTTIAKLESEKEAIKKENQEFKSRLDNIEQILAVKSSSSAILSAAQLEQNAPNPFNQNTIIKYYLPENIHNARLAITDASGKTIKTISVTTKGNGQFVLEGGQLAAGTYQYSLIVNEKSVDTKKMVILR